MADSRLTYKARKGDGALAVAQGMGAENRYAAVAVLYGSGQIQQSRQTNRGNTVAGSEYTFDRSLFTPEQLDQLEVLGRKIVSSEGREDQRRIAVAEARAVARQQERAVEVAVAANEPITVADMLAIDVALKNRDAALEANGQQKPFELTKKDLAPVLSYLKTVANSPTKALGTAGPNVMSNSDLVAYMRGNPGPPNAFQRSLNVVRDMSGPTAFFVKTVLDGIGDATAGYRMDGYNPRDVQR
jgi:hypothetical protein